MFYRLRNSGGEYPGGRRVWQNSREELVIVAIFVFFFKILVWNFIRRKFTGVSYYSSENAFIFWEVAFFRWTVVEVWRLNSSFVMAWWNFAISSVLNLCKISQHLRKFIFPRLHDSLKTLLRLSRLFVLFSVSSKSQTSVYELHIVEENLAVGLK